MRTRQEIKNEMTTNFIGNEEVINRYGLKEGKNFEEQFSKVSLENIWFNIISYAYFLHEQIFEQHETEVNEILLQKNPHTLRWYRNKALEFMYGYDLIEDTDKYNITELSDEDIETAKIIKYSAVVEAEAESRLIVKIATEGNGKLKPISNTQKEAFDAYLNEIKDAGVNITVINYLPDLLKINLRIFRDPLLLDENGVSRLTGKKPVEEALQEFMKELPFNGELILQELANKLEKAEGVDIVQIDQIQSRWVDANGGNYGNYNNIDVAEIPVSGYFEIENFKGVKYVVRD